MWFILALPTGIKGAWLGQCEPVPAGRYESNFLLHILCHSKSVFLGYFYGNICEGVYCTSLHNYLQRYILDQLWVICGIDLTEHYFGLGEGIGL